MGTPFLRQAPPAGALRSLAPLLAAAPDNLNVFDPLSPPADSIRGLFYLVLAITGVIFLLVEGMLVYCIIRFRQKASDGTAEPPQLYGSKPVEVAWTVAPLLIVFVLFLVVARTIAEVRIPEPKPGPDVLRVTVVGHQWWWEYRYPKQPALGDEEGFVTANELHVPAGKPVYFDLESADVIHSFWFPRLNGKTDVIPGRVNHTWFLAQRDGTFLGQCTEYCGTQHANMILRLEADPPDKFAAWAQKQRQRAAEDPAVIPGRDVFMANACRNCHTIRGTPANGTFGPDLTHLAGRQTLASAMVPNDTKNLTQWVADPQVIKPGCWMPDMKLDGRQRNLVVKYLQSLK